MVTRPVHLLTTSFASAHACVPIKDNFEYNMTTKLAFSLRRKPSGVRSSRLARVEGPRSTWLHGVEDERQHSAGITFLGFRIRIHKNTEWNSRENVFSPMIPRDETFNWFRQYEMKDFFPLYNDFLTHHHWEFGTIANVEKRTRWEGKRD